MRVLLLFICLWFSFLSSFGQFSQRYELVKIGKEVNTHYHEAAPIISPDGKTLYFFVDNHPENKYGKDGSQDIWISKKDDEGNWSQATHLGSPFNDSRSNQVFTVFEDGSLFIKGAGKNKKGMSLVTGKSEVVLDVKDFNKMNNGRFYGASMSADKKHMIIYFSEIKNSARSDLYVSHLESGTKWSAPKKLKINNNMDDFAPFIGPDQKTLYFASSRAAKGRQGSADIYKCTRLDNTWENWSTPVNMGPSVNTKAMDAYFSMDAHGDVFVARSNSRIDGGNLDIFILVEKAIKIKLVGMVFDEKTKTPIDDASLEIKVPDADLITVTSDSQDGYTARIPEVDQYAISVSAEGYLPKDITGKLPRFEKDTTLLVDVYLTPVTKRLILKGNVYDQKTNNLITADLNITLKGSNAINYDLKSTGGKYQRELSKYGWYIIAASKEGYINTIDSVSIVSVDESPMEKDVFLQPIEVGITVRLKNVYFDFDKTSLKEESFSELDKVGEFLQMNPSVEVEIAGHTDNKGSDSYNRDLSQGRCQSVVEYLQSQGISEHRLVAKGYGESKPIDSNDSEEGRANNRRVEFTVLKK